MAYREVTMVEITEVLRQWVAGARRKQIARRLGLDPKTVRRYLRAAERCGLAPGLEAAALTDERVTAIVTLLRGGAERPYGASWQQCEAQRDFIAENNPPALQEIAARFSEAVDRGLWAPRRNSTYEELQRLAGRVVA